MLRAAAAVAASIGLAACASISAPAPARSSAYADYLIGRVANARDDYGAASDRYFSALARAPQDQALLQGALVASLAAGDETRARRAARMAPRADAPAYAHLIRASDALVAQRWRAATQELDEVEGAAAEEIIGRMLLVWARTGERRVDEGTQDLTPLTQIRPYGGLFAYQQAMAWDYAGRQDEALAAYEVALRGGLWLPSGIERHADLLVRRGAREQAIELLSAEVNRPNPALAAALERVRAGGRASQQPLTPARGAAVGLYGLSAVFQQESDSTSGLTSLSLALMLDPDFDGARLAFAQQQARLGHTATARAMFARIPANSPYAGSARTMESWIVLEAGDEDEAVSLARASAAGGDARAQRTLADMYRNLGRHADAEPLYGALIEQQPQDWRLYFSRGAAREQLGRWPEAEADFMRALELSPEQPDVMNYLGYTWIDRGERLQEGLAMIQRAVELRPTSGAIIDSLGWAYYQLGDYAQALDHLERAVELEPADPTLNDHLGDVYWRLGRRIEARFQWQRALSFEPDDPTSIQAKIDNGLPALPPSRSANR
ncbi:tetratricopeptide repeat protein [Terricaulis sp.]|uniref:tetratricopeptide repeat protein n=1 Tax=Terricaulis sp. TaxID=2768686 RepID=UPI002AC3F697|nr:tetratricopeptide repeat protein [Terricaulis sp.]MDZ4692146.1 tetratricopeptide repeat protein [Terricaulis sp.]